MAIGPVRTFIITFRSSLHKKGESNWTNFAHHAQVYKAEILIQRVTDNSNGGSNCCRKFDCRMTRKMERFHSHHKIIGE